MKCPACKEVSLSIAERQDIEIDYCAQCRGVWLDRGELDRLLDRATDVECRNTPPASTPRTRRLPRRALSGRRKSWLGEILDF